MSHYFKSVKLSPTQFDPDLQRVLDKFTFDTLLDLKVSFLKRFETVSEFVFENVLYKSDTLNEVADVI